MRDCTGSQVPLHTELLVLLLPALLLALAASQGREDAYGHEAAAAAHHVTALRVCADPNNLPFFNEKGESSK